MKGVSVLIFNQRKENLIKLPCTSPFFFLVLSFHLIYKVTIKHNLVYVLFTVYTRDL